MKVKIYLIIIVLFISANLYAQQFISKAVIEFEVKSNFKKNMGNRSWIEQIDNLSTFKTGYFTLTFADNKSIYKYVRTDENTKTPFSFFENDAENFWFNDYFNNNFVMQKAVFGETYLLTDSLLKTDWRITNENREIAGFNCRKAIGKIFDSVYIFAFYTDEIIVSGGPMSLHGLPGMILGLTIPRMFTSWVATKIQVAGVEENKITAPTKGKKKKARELQQTVEKATKDWGKYGQQAVWNIFL